MKHLILVSLVCLLSVLMTTSIMAAKESFDRSKPHMAELAKIEAACKNDKKKCAELKMAYKKKYNKEANLKDYNSSRSNNSSSRAQDYNSSRSNTTRAMKDASDDLKKKNLSVKAPRDAATGLPTGKRQHKAIMIPKNDCVDGKVIRGKHKDKKCEHRGHVTVLK